MDDRFIGYRGSQENEWSWEPDKATGPSRYRARGRRTMALAILSACTLIAVVAGALYLLAGTGGEDSGSVVMATSTPTRRPTASATERPPAAPTTTPDISPLPSSPALLTALSAWNSRLGKWQQDSLLPGRSDYSEGDVVPFLLSLWNAEPGHSYEVAINYFDCGLSPERSFDYLGSVEGWNDAPRLVGPGRVRPDSQVPVPASGNAAGTGAYLAAWGGTFQEAPQMSPVTSSCAGDQSLTIRILARSSTIHIEWGAHLAAVIDWPNDGAASARAPFGMSAVLQGTPERRIEVLPNAISR